jgi:hypothetical protein
MPAVDRPLTDYSARFGIEELAVYKILLGRVFARLRAPENSRTEHSSLFLPFSEKLSAIHSWLFGRNAGLALVPALKNSDGFRCSFAVLRCSASQTRPFGSSQRT